MANADDLNGARQDALKQPAQVMVAECGNKDRPRHWIEIVLRTDSGDPVPGEEYMVVAPDQAVYTGVLDEAGFARIDGLPAGQCKVSFPLIDKREWSVNTSGPAN